jgi:hypothetical protein
MSFRPALEWRGGEVSQNRQVEGPFLAVFRDTALRVRSSQMGRQQLSAVLKGYFCYPPRNRTPLDVNLRGS